MGWEMVKKYEPPHKCDRPQYYDAFSAPVNKGDIIKCDCGQHWICTDAVHTSDQREGTSRMELLYSKVADPVAPQTLLHYAQGVR